MTRRDAALLIAINGLLSLAMAGGVSAWSLRTEHGAYSEIYIHSPVGNGIGRLIVDPYSLLLFSSRAEDFNAINEKRATGLTVSQAIDAVLQDRSVQ